MKKVEVLSIPVHTGPYEEFILSIVRSAFSNESSYACIANVHMLIEAHGDPAFAKVISQADLVTPDGKPLAWAMKMLYGIKQPRVAGMDLLPDILTACLEHKIPIFFYGGTPELLDTTKAFLHENYPLLSISGFYSPPFYKMTEDEEEAVIRRINDANPKIVFVVLGCPKQEKWMASMQGRIRGIAIGIGGALPVLVGLRPRAPRWMQNNGMEWVFRLIQEPHRLFRRYAVTNSIFLYLIAKQYVKVRFNNRRIKASNIGI